MVISSSYWEPASQAAQGSGLSMALMGKAGSGKTTMCAGSDTLLIDFEGGRIVLSDRPDVMVWPPRDKKTGKIPRITWDGFSELNDHLLSGSSPFRTVVFDTMNAMYGLAMNNKVLKGARDKNGVPVPPEWSDYRKANALVGEVVREWSLRATEEGINVVFITHAKEVKTEGDTLLIRMDMTPEVITTINQAVDAIGYLETKPNSRKLILHNTHRVDAKYRQPRTGQQLPDEILDPSLAKILEFRNKVLNGKGKA